MAKEIQILDSFGTPIKAEASYRGARYNRELGLWSPQLKSADSDLLPDLKTLTARAHDLSRNYALTSGDIGYHFLVRVLSKNGRSDVLYKMNNRSDRPGYAYQLKKGATSLTESWAALPEVSNNHMMLGHLMEWFYSGLGGIYQADNSIAYSDIIIAPKPVGKINWVNCSYNSAKGPIISDWKIEDNIFILNIEIPEKASAKVILPEDYRRSSCKVTDLIKQGDIKIEISEGAFKVEPGKYKIVAK